MPEWAPSTSKVCTRLGREASRFCGCRLEAALLRELLRRAASAKESQTS